MKKKLFPQYKNIYKANMHTHTNLSDGALSPEEIKDSYREKGYSIVAFTDHEVMVRQTDLRDENFLPINAYEIAIAEELPNAVPNGKKTYHLNLYAKNEDETLQPVLCEGRIGGRIEHIKAYLTDEMRVAEKRYEYGVEEINEVIRRANEAGFLVCYNHPVWSLQNYADYAGLRGLWGVEVHNTGCVRSGYLDTVQPMEDLLREGERVYAVAADDTHSPNDRFGGWLMVSSDALEYGAIMRALENGDFYASTGPEIREISLEDGVLHVECSEASAVFVSTERRESKRVSATDQPLTQVDFDLSRYLSDLTVGTRRCDPYVRVTVVDAQGNRAWSRAYFMD